MVIQIIGQACAGVTPYCFELYQIMGWVAQIIYWILSICIAAVVGLEEL